MKLNVSETPDQAAVVSFSTDNLDSSNVLEFREAMQQITATHQVVVLDMQPLTFVDSSGLGALLSCLRIMNGKNGQLRLFGMSKSVKALFELVRMHRIFTIYTSRQEALEDTAAA